MKLVGLGLLRVVGREVVYRKIQMLTGNYRATNEWRGEVTSLPV